MSRLSVGAPILIACLLLGLVPELSAQYGGPSLLSRGGNSPGRRGRALQKINGYVSGRFLYESGLRVAQLDDDGILDPISSPGFLVEGGVYGGHDWRRVSVGLDYRADYRNITNNAGFQGRNPFTGSNHVVAADVTIRASRRTTVSLNQTGGTTNRAFGAFAAPAFGNTNRIGVPLNEVFDARTYFSQAEVSVTSQRTARLALTGSATGFFIRRTGLSLVNTQGYRATGGVGYRITRRTSLLANYQWIQFSFPRLFARSDMHGIGGGLQHMLTRKWTLQGIGGAFRVASTGTESVELSPEVAAILGRATGQVFFRRTLYSPLVDVSATYTHDRGSLRLQASSMVIPGNGVFLTANMQNLSAGYSYAGTRRLSLGANGGYMRMNSASLRLPNLRSYQFGGGFTYRVSEGLNLMSQIDRRTFNNLVVGGRSGYAMSIGLAYNPSRFPIAIW